MLMRTFGWSEFYVRWGIVGARGWAYLAWATEHESSLLGGGRVRTTDGYIKQEVKRIKEKRKQNV